MQARVERASSLQHALALRGEGFVPLSGATDIYPGMLPRLGKPSMAPQRYVDLTALEELRAVKIEADRVQLGAMATWTAIAKAQLPRQCLSLQQAATEIGGIQIQNQATIGGNICNASPAADGVAVLFALDAVMVLQSSQHSRKLPISEFVLGNRETALRPDELLTGIEIPLSRERGTSHFSKIGGRKYLIISIASAAVRLRSDGEAITSAAVSVGSCSAVPLRLPALEASLVGLPVRADQPLAMEPRWFSPLQPIDDVRGSRAFRLEAAGVLVRRTLAACMQDLAAAPDDRK